MVEGKLFFNDGKYIETSRGVKESFHYYNFKTPNKEIFYSFSGGERRYGNYSGKGNEFFDFEYKYKDLPFEIQIEKQIEEFKSHEIMKKINGSYEFESGYCFKESVYYQEGKIEESIKQTAIQNICNIYRKECLRLNNINPFLKLNSIFRVQKMISDYFSFNENNNDYNFMELCCLNIYDITFKNKDGETILSNLCKEKVMSFFEEHYCFILQNLINILLIQCFKEDTNDCRNLDRLLYNRRWY